MYISFIFLVTTSSSLTFNFYTDFSVVFFTTCRFYLLSSRYLSFFLHNNSITDNHSPLLFYFFLSHILSVLFFLPSFSLMVFLCSSNIYHNRFLRTFDFAPAFFYHFSTRSLLFCPFSFPFFVFHPLLASHTCSNIHTYTTHIYTSTISLVSTMTYIRTAQIFLFFLFSNFSESYGDEKKGKQLILKKEIKIRRIKNE